MVMISSNISPKEDGENYVQFCNCNLILSICKTDWEYVWQLNQRKYLIKLCNKCKGMISEIMSPYIIWKVNYLEKLGLKYQLISCHVLVTRMTRWKIVIIVKICIIF